MWCAKVLLQSCAVRADQARAMLPSSWESWGCWSGRVSSLSSLHADTASAVLSWRAGQCLTLRFQDTYTRPVVWNESLIFPICLWMLSLNPSPFLSLWGCCRRCTQLHHSWLSSPPFLSPVLLILIHLHGVLSFEVAPAVLNCCWQEC